MTKNTLPKNLISLHTNEEELRGKALQLIENDSRLELHIKAVEQAMSLANLLRQYETDDEDMKVIQFLGMRVFNAFGASLKLSLSGYLQNSTLIMRDILETLFLLDLFKGDRTRIKEWRSAEKKDRMKNFSPVKVREALDTRDGLFEKKRAEIYDMFSELAGHPNMNSVLMMRPKKDSDDIFIGPFMEKTSLVATIAEMGRLAIQVGEILDSFFPDEFQKSLSERITFAENKQIWIAKFYPNLRSNKETQL